MSELNETPRTLPHWALEVLTRETLSWNRARLLNTHEAFLIGAAITSAQKALETK